MHRRQVGDEDAPMLGDGEPTMHGDEDAEPKPSLPTAEDIHDYLQQKPDSFHSANSRKNQKHQENREVSLSGMILNLVRSLSWCTSLQIILSFHQEQ